MSWPWVSSGDMLRRRPVTAARIVRDVEVRILAEGDTVGRHGCLINGLLRLRCRSVGCLPSHIGRGLGSYLTCPGLQYISLAVGLYRHGWDFSMFFHVCGWYWVIFLPTVIIYLVNYIYRR